MVTKKKLENLKLKDEGFQSAKSDALKFLDSKRNIFYKIASKYHLDSDELFQEAYEVLLTCLRDFQPVLVKEEGEVTVKFNTFFGSRIEMKALELRNNNPEYKARKAYTDGMDNDLKAEFRKNAPLLVQHIDHTETVNEFLSDEITKAKQDENPDIQSKFNRDSFLDEVLTDLINKEKDDKKRSVLQHVKVGGIMNFQDIAYHFGVTDSRASQLMNELMDAFYAQRLINGDVETVLKDLKRLKLSGSRIKTLLQKAIDYAEKEIKIEIKDRAIKLFPEIKNLDIEKNDKHDENNSIVREVELIPYKDVLTDEENAYYPQVEVGMRDIKELKFLDLSFRSKLHQNIFNAFVQKMPEDNNEYPVIINKEGFIIDGELKVRAAKIKGIKSLYCITRVASEQDAKVLRIIINNRLDVASKKHLFYSVCALLSLGFSQQKISSMLDTSRTNVIVYAKVKEKAIQEVKQLFEDDMILITNASACADITPKQQLSVVNFIKKYGIKWSKGNRFSKLLHSAKNDAIKALEKAEHPDFMKSENLDVLIEADKQYTERLTKQAQTKIIELKDQLKDTTVRLQDSETWLSHRESVINQQQKELSELKEENLALQKEIEVSQLLKFADKSVFEDEIKYLKKVYELTEILNGAEFALTKSIEKIDTMQLKPRQLKDIDSQCLSLVEKIEELRVRVFSKHSS